MQSTHIENIKNNADLIIKEKQSNYESNSIELDKKVNNKKLLEEITKNKIFFFIYSTYISNNSNLHNSKICGESGEGEKNRKKPVWETSGE